jgi:predicted transcriptional regulator
VIDLPEVEAEIVALIIEFGWLEVGEIMDIVGLDRETINEALEELLDDELLVKCELCNCRICYNLGL